MSTDQRQGTTHDSTSSNTNTNINFNSNPLNTTSENNVSDRTLDFAHDDFDPLKALNSPNLQPPFPNVSTYICIHVCVLLRTYIHTCMYARFCMKYM